MLQQNSATGNEPKGNSSLTPDNSWEISGGEIEVNSELDRLEEMILNSTRLPFTAKILLNEDKLLEQLDQVRLSLPDALAQASEIVDHQEAIVLQAENYAKAIVSNAQQRADKILKETELVKQAEEEAKQIRQQVQQECKQMREKTLAEVTQIQEQTQRELAEMRQSIILECQDIEKGADDYADTVLSSIEKQLQEMLTVIRNGRQELNNNC